VSVDPTRGCEVDGDTVAWWHMSDGRVLGVYDGRLIEYEPSTLAPLGLVVGADELKGKRVIVVGSGSEECKVDTGSRVSTKSGMEGADCVESEGEEQAVLLVDDNNGMVTVVQPNEDGSYWRKIVRNKMIRMKEKRRIQAATAFAEEEMPDLVKNNEETGAKTFEGKIVSSWGPYTSIVGTAVKTGVAGLTAKADLSSAEKEVAKVAWGQLGGPGAASGAWRLTGMELREAFQALDADQSGSLSPSELAMALKEFNPTATEAEIGDIITLADADKDGNITLEEFVMLMLFRVPNLSPKEPAAV